MRVFGPCVVYSAVEAAGIGKEDGGIPQRTAELHLVRGVEVGGFQADGALCEVPVSASRVLVEPAGKEFLVPLRVSVRERELIPWRPAQI